MTGNALQQTLAPGTAAALDLAFAIRHVIVGELFALTDVARRADPDGVADDVHVAVRPARMVDESRHVAADSRVAHPAPIQLEAPDAAVLHVPPFAPETLLVRDLFARVVDDARVLGDALVRKHSPA